MTQPADEEFFAAIGPDLTIHFIMLAAQDSLFLILPKVNKALNNEDRKARLHDKMSPSHQAQLVWADFLVSYSNLRS